MAEGKTSRQVEVSWPWRITGICIWRWCIFDGQDYFSTLRLVELRMIRNLGQQRVASRR